MTGLNTALRPALSPIIHAEGARFRLADDRELLDLSCQTLNLALGQNHPAVTAAVVAQASVVQYASSRFGTVPFLALSERLAAIAPEGLDTVVLKLTNGSDAVETALKLAMLHTRRRLVGCLPGAWHGETFLALVLATTHRGRLISADACGVAADTPDIRSLTRLVMSRRDLAAVIIDPAQVSNGLPRTEIGQDLEELRAACHASGSLLIFDEIQTFGGWLAPHLFAAEATGVRPDLICLGKALGAGYPLAAVLCRNDLAALLQYNDAEFTYGGHPVSCAAALAGLDVVQGLRAELEGRGDALGGFLKTAFPSTYYETRRLGLIVTVTLAEERLREVWTRRFVAEAMRQGLFFRNTDHGRRVLIKPPLVLAENDLASAIARAGAVATTVRTGLGRVQPALMAQRASTALRDCLLRKPVRPNPNGAYVTSMVATFDPHLCVTVRGPREQEQLTRRLTAIGIPAAIMYAVAGVDAVDYDFVEGRSLQEVLADESAPEASVNGLALRHYELVTRAHDHGIVVGDRWPGNAIVSGHASLQLIDFELSYDGPFHVLALLEETFCVLQTLAALPATTPLASDLARRLTEALTERHGPVHARSALERLGTFYRSPSRPIHPDSAPAQTYCGILDSALARIGA